MSEIIHVLIIFIILRNAQILAEATNYSQPHPKIIDGVPVEEGQAKFMVSVRARLNLPFGVHLCGGSLISYTKILTAAHCFFKVTDDKQVFLLPPASYYVTMGSLFNNGTNVSTFNIAYYVYHKDYDPGIKGRDDIAVVFLAKLDWLDLSSFSNIGTIMLTDRRVKPGENCIVYGWGLTNRLNLLSYSAILHQVNMSIIDYEKCAKSYSSQFAFVFDTEFCAGTWTGGKAACLGDTGGPLVCDGKVAGIASRSYNCALPEFPTIFQDIFEYNDWIDHGYKKFGSQFQYGNSNIVKMDYFLIIYLIFLWIFI